jgi:hypothetical protein
MKIIQRISILYLIISPIITSSQSDIYITQIDTIKIHESHKPLIFFTMIDTIGRKYFITKIEVYDPRKETLLQIIEDTSSYNFDGGLVSYFDINFDGYNDIEIDCGVNNLIPIYSFWLYDKKKKRYVYSSDFSQLHRYHIDKDNKEISSVAQSLGGSGGYSCLYRVKMANYLKFWITTLIGKIMKLPFILIIKKYKQLDGKLMFQILKMKMIH